MSSKQYIIFFFADARDDGSEVTAILRQKARIRADLASTGKNEPGEEFGIPRLGGLCSCVASLTDDEYEKIRQDHRIAEVVEDSSRRANNHTVFA